MFHSLGVTQVQMVHTPQLFETEKSVVQQADRLGTMAAVDMQVVAAVY